MAARQSAEQLLRRMADRHAPDEARDLALIMRRCLAEPARMYPARRSGAQLASGFSEAAVVVVPILMGVLNDLGEDGLKRGLAAAWHRWRRRRHVAVLDPAAPLGQFTPEMTALARAAVLQRLLRQGMKAPDAERVADDFAAELGGAR